jgi:hypothetical protein
MMKSQKKPILCIHGLDPDKEICLPCDRYARWGQ